MKVETVNYKSEALQLYKAGEESSDIVAALFPKVSQATIYRWIKEFKTANLRGVDLDPEEEYLFGDSSAPTSDDSLDKIGEKRSILKRFKKLLKEILAYGEGYTWNNSQLRTVLRTAERLQDDVEKVCDFEKSQFENNMVWKALDFLIDDFQEHVFRHPDEVELHLTPEEKLEFEYYLTLDDFDQEYEPEAIASVKYLSYLEMINRYAEEEEEFSVSECEDLLVTTENIEEELEELEMEEELSLVVTIKEAVEGMLEEAQSAFIFANATLDLPEEVLEQINVELNDDQS